MLLEYFMHHNFASTGFLSIVIRVSASNLCCSIDMFVVIIVVVACCFWFSGDIADFATFNKSSIRRKKKQPT